MVELVEIPCSNTRFLVVVITTKGIMFYVLDTLIKQMCGRIPVSWIRFFVLSLVLSVKFWGVY